MKFEKVSRLAAVDFNLPVRKTKNSAGYDFEVAEDIIIPTWTNQLMKLSKMDTNPDIKCVPLDILASWTKASKAKPTLVSTGVKCQLDEGYYLELSVRSSTPLKYWIVLANGVGIIDADYYNNPDNEGEIFFQVINMSPYPIELKKGDIIGQGIIKKYHVVEADAAAGDRMGGFGSTSNAIQYTVKNGEGIAINRGMRANSGIIEEAISDELKKEIQNAIMNSKGGMQYHV